MPITRARRNGLSAATGAGRAPHAGKAVRADAGQRTGVAVIVDRKGAVRGRAVIAGHVPAATGSRARAEVSFGNAANPRRPFRKSR